MKGYSPSLNLDSKKETSSKKVNKFIEIGTVTKHGEDCICKKCSIS